MFKYNQPGCTEDHYSMAFISSLRCSCSKSNVTETVLNKQNIWKYKSKYSWLLEVGWQNESQDQSLQHLQTHNGTSACTSFGFHTRLLHMLHISRWVSRLQEFTPVEWVVIMHVAKCFSSSWTLCYLHGTHLLSLREQMAASETFDQTRTLTDTHRGIQSGTL